MKEKERNRMNNCIRFSIRLPKDQHEWLKQKSISTKGSNKYISMNDYITMAIDMYKNSI